VLDLDAAPDDRAALLTAIQSAFGTPLDSEEDVRERMRVVMLNLVVGEHAPASLGADIDYLIRLVNNPMRRAIFGRFAAGRRRRFYTTLRRARDEADAHSLLERSRDAAIVRGAELGDDEAIEQVPHWMFPFTGSASDLLTRTLAMIGSRPDTWRRIEDELAAVAPAADPERIDRLSFIEACILETGRLFPPVTRTFHTAPLGDTTNGVAVPADIEVVHFFPLLQRDPASGSDVNAFRPEQWLAEASEVRPTSNLFLSGARACPGRDLVLFVLKAAIATHVARHQRHMAALSLSRDPVPFSYPRHEVGLLAGRPAQPSSDQTATVEAG
jgi:cytochrome P450